MYINPRIAIQEGWVNFPDWMTEAQREKCIQPNALDFTVDKLLKINPTACLIGESEKLMRKGQEVELDPTDFWDIEVGSYDFMSDFYVDLPEGVAAQVVARSTFVRNGMFITTGLWDSGFKGPAGGVLHNVVGSAKVARHVRVGQLIFIRSDAGGLYAGGYNTDAGVHWTNAAK